MKSASIAAVSAIVACTACSDLERIETERTLTTVGHARILVAPDRARLQAAVVTEDATPVAALQANNGLMHAVHDAIARLGIPFENVETNDVSVEPVDPNQYAERPPPGPRVIRYHVENTVTVRTEDLTRVADIMGTLVTAGANQIRDVRFEVKDSDRYLEEARVAAIKDAHARAERMADAAGVTLGPVIRIGSGTRGTEEIPETVLITGSLISSTTRVPVIAGKREINADVTVVYRIR
jgi:uncharacterized protein YggE